VHGVSYDHGGIGIGIGLGRAGMALPGQNFSAALICSRAKRSPHGGQEGRVRRETGDRLGANCHRGVR